MPRIIAVLLGLATVSIRPATAAAYQLKTTEAGATVHWSRPVITIALSREAKEHFHDGHARRALDAAIEAWLDAWSEVPGTPVFAIDTSDASEPGVHTGGPTNGVYVPEEWPYDPGRLAVTVSAFDPSTGELLDTDIYLNPSYAFDDLSRGSPRLRYDLATVLTHELGHALGLGESEDPASAMWPAIPPGRMTRTIGDDDVAGVAAVYGPLDVGGTGCYATVAGAGAPSELAPLLLALALIWRRRR